MCYDRGSAVKVKKNGVVIIDRYFDSLKLVNKWGRRSYKGLVCQ